MNWTSALAIYFLIWFGVLFLVLPFHAARASRLADAPERVAGEDPGAPKLFRPLRAALETTVIAALLFALYYFVYSRQLFSGHIDLSWLGAPPLR